MMDRRELFRQAAAVAAGTAVAGREAFAQRQSAAPAAPAAGGQQATEQQAGEESRFLPGFTVAKVQTGGTTIHAVKGGQGPPLLLLHGAPQSHITWRHVAPVLAKQYTVVAADLRGYGDSGKMPDTPDHAGYSKRAMALDQVEVMKHFGFDRFPVVGQDRGGRVAHRMALDHPDKVTKIAVLDIIPTYYLYTHVTKEFIQAYFHWFNNVRPAPAPENEMKAAADRRPPATDPVAAEYQRTTSRMENIHAMCEDYRAAASIDLRHDAADIKTKIKAPLLTLWSAPGAMGRLYDVLAIWRERGTRVSGKGLTGGHNLQEDVPAEVLAELTAFLRA